MPGYDQYLAQAVLGVTDRVHSKEFADTMRRFLPENTLNRTPRRDGFLDYLSGGVTKLLEEARSALRPGRGTAASYKM